MPKDYLANDTGYLILICFKNSTCSLLQTRTPTSWGPSLQLLCRPKDSQKVMAAIAGYLRGDDTSVFLPRYLTYEWNIKKSVLSLNPGVQRLTV